MNGPDGDGRSREPDWEAVRNFHKAILDALRHREQDIVRFVVILVSALGGFVWLIQQQSPYRLQAVVVGSYGVLLALTVGALYALSLGYNYRSLTFQIARLEEKLRLQKLVLAAWPGGATSAEETIASIERRCRWGVIPWCTPPEIIKWFWFAFLASILLVTVMGYVGSQDSATNDQSQEVPVVRAGQKHQVTQYPLVGAMAAARKALPWMGGACIVLAALAPIHFGRKMLRLCREQRLREQNQRADQKIGLQEERT